MNERKTKKVEAPSVNGLDSVDQHISVRYHLNLTNPPVSSVPVPKRKANVTNHSGALSRSSPIEKSRRMLRVRWDSGSIWQRATEVRSSMHCQTICWPVLPKSLNVISSHQWSGDQRVNHRATVFLWGLTSADAGKCSIVSRDAVSLLEWYPSKTPRRNASCEV